MIVADFGDGYQQTAVDGLNASLISSLDLNWDPIMRGDADTIVDFLKAHVGAVFFYTIPGEDSPRKWLCGQWQRTRGGGWDALTASLTERADLS